jgi:hypothetical protein
MTAHHPGLKAEGTKTMLQHNRGCAGIVDNLRETADRPARNCTAPALDAADWLHLAATPTFAIMALLTGALGGGPSVMICSAAHDGFPLSGMVPMYLLMSAFHSAPWLKLISSRRRPDGTRSMTESGRGLEGGRLIGGD